jgi:hypothetical protein
MAVVTSMVGAEEARDDKGRRGEALGSISIAVVGATADAASASPRVTEPETERSATP